jgi:hypothetical protein
MAPDLNNQTPNQMEMPCDQVQHALLLLVDGPDFFEANNIDPISVDKHLERCAPCKDQVEAERVIHELMRSLLQNACCEKAPEELIESIHQQIQETILSQGFAQGFTQSQPTFITEFRMSQVSIEIDEFGQVQHREIHIESTQEFHDPEI